MSRSQNLLAAMSLAALMAACAHATRQSMIVPKEVIDLGALVTPDLPERLWGRGFFASLPPMGLIAGGGG